MVLILLQGNAMAQGMETLSIPSDRAVLVVEATTGQVLYTQRAQETMYPASLTKVLTALVVLDAWELDEFIVPGGEMDRISPQSSRAHLVKDRPILVKDALAALLLPSGNDAAIALAVQTARKTAGDPQMPMESALKAFSEAMNEKGKNVGMLHSHFVNPHGLHDPDHYTTAQDLLILAQTALQDPFLSDLVEKPFYETQDGRYRFASTNVYLHPRLEDVWFLYQSGANPHYRPDVQGIKTGNTIQAGRCLMFKAEMGDKEVLAILLHSDMDSIYDEGIRILDGVFEGMDWTSMPEPEKWDTTIQVDGLAIFPGPELELTNGEGDRRLVEKERLAQTTLTFRITSDKLSLLEDGSYQLTGNVKTGETVGVLELMSGQDVLATSPIQAGSGIGILHLWLPLLALMLVFLVMMGFAWNMKRRKKKRRLR